MSPLVISIGEHGGLVDASIGVSVPRESDLKYQGLSVPGRVSIQALIDTGASQSCIDPSIAQRLHLTPTGRNMVHTGSSGANAHGCNAFDVRLIVPHSERSLIVPALPVCEIELAVQRQPFMALFGRDVLEKCIMIYQGTAKQILLLF